MYVHIYAQELEVPQSMNLKYFIIQKPEALFKPYEIITLHFLVKSYETIIKHPKIA